VRTRPTGGGDLSTLLNPARFNITDYDIQSNVAADDSHIYLARANGEIVRLSRTAPFTTPLSHVVDKATRNSDTPDLALDGTYVYWVENIIGVGGQPNRSSIYRMPKNGGSRQLMRRLTGTLVTKLRADGVGGVYYLATEYALLPLPNMLIRTFPSGSTFTNTFTAGVYVNDYAFDDTYLYWADHSAQTNGILRIKRVPRSAMSSTPTELADRGNTGAPRVTSIAVDAAHRSAARSTGCRSAAASRRQLRGTSSPPMTSPRTAATCSGSPAEAETYINIPRDHPQSRLT
jgi:hypothetical protein